MALYHCPACDTTVDTDCAEGPEGVLWCEKCIAEYEQDQELIAIAREWYDYEPDA